MPPLTELYMRPWALRRRLGWSLAVVSVIGTLVFSALSYQATRQTTLSSIDDTLCAAAEGVRAIVPPIIVVEAEAPARTEPAYTEAFRATQVLLERYFASMNLEYIYAIGVHEDGSAFEMVGNLSAEQKAAKIDPLKDLLLKPYPASDGMKGAAKSGKRVIDIAHDDYGYFRSCLVPVKMGNVTAIYGADLDISAVDARLTRELLTNLGIGALVLMVTLTVIRAISNGVARDVRFVVGETAAVAQLDFTGSEERRHSSILEVDQLFTALTEMKGGLKAFGKFVPASVVKRVLAAGRADVGGEQRELSLLMTDVTDFTTISEKLAPERVMQVMSEYFGTVVAPILELQGTLDKYVGDAIFAYWNAPMRLDNHAVLACRAALKSRTASRALAVRWQAAGEFPWHTRFGLHAGETVFGNVGAPDRMDFTVIGSSVNLASRIEGLNKFYGTEILASERLRALAMGAFVFRNVDRVLPKGAVYPFEIFELIGAVADVDGAALARLARWEAAMALFTARDWNAALAAFVAYCATETQDHLAKFYVKRCRDMIANPPPASWDGVQPFEMK